ncbi:MAG: hypothetical protein M1829_003005 [Trizodia sp. TS-e1964]|nr:MAG: hypothetical protein M1829_003005 [Trizodia sp. TS-e1964]
MWRFRSKKSKVKGEDTFSVDNLSNPEEFTAIEDKYGIKTLHNPESPKVDLVFVHGLTGGQTTTWTADGEDASWPEKLLAKDIPEARILAFGYDADVVKLLGQASQNTLAQHARNLLGDLADTRFDTNTTGLPIIFVVHSLGGLICMNALTVSNNAEANQRQILDCTHAIAFLGTPHRGSALASWAALAANLASVAKKVNKSILDTLHPQSEVLSILVNEFHPMLRSRERNKGSLVSITCYAEELDVSRWGKTFRVVPKESATLEQYPQKTIHSDHIGMTKFKERDSGYLRHVDQNERALEKLSNLQDINQHINNPKTQMCLMDLRTTDPRYDKRRIQETKGGLLADLSRWVFYSEDFQRWRNEREIRLLWIKGDPGKGKTMLICGIIDELKSSVDSGLLSFFFCQGTDSRINNASAVLRGLIYQIVDQQPSLISHIREKYDHAGKELFRDINAWFALSEIFKNILLDPNLKAAYLIIDALDECGTDLAKLLDCVVQNLTTSPRIKWIVSSRNRTDIEQKLQLESSLMKLSLELKENAEQVSKAVDTYIDYCVSRLEPIKNDKSLQDQVRDKIRQRANGTFLWVSLVLKELKQVEAWEILGVVDEVPIDLKEVYGRMMKQIERLKLGNSELCLNALSTVTTAYRPLHLAELGVLSGMPKEILSVNESVVRIVSLCASFLTIRDEYVYIIHQSAKDFLSTDTSHKMFLNGVREVHHAIFLRSLQVMSITLRRDIYGLSSKYGLCAPGIPIDQVKQPNPDPLAAAGYSCLYWIDHLCDLDSSKSVKHINDLQDGGMLDKFLRQHYLYWLEGLSLLRGIPQGILSIAKLESLLQGKAEAPQLTDLIQDAHRFILYHKWPIENTPLQVYTSALVFSPNRSLIRILFEQEEPEWIITKPVMQENWSSCLQTLEGHSGRVISVAFSHDSKQLASASWDKTIKIWNPASGFCLQTLEGHNECVKSVAFSHDSKQLASASWDKTIKIWDPASGSCLQTLEGHSDCVTFSHDSKQLASASWDKTIKIWNPASGSCLRTLEGHSGEVISVAFSHDSKQLASASWDKTIKIWNPASGFCLQTLEGHSGGVNSVAFSHNSKQLASTSFDKTIKIWNPASGFCLQTLEGHNEWVKSVAFSLDSKQLASASTDETIKIWDTASGSCLETLDIAKSNLYYLVFGLTDQYLYTDDSAIVLYLLSASSTAPNMSAFQKPQKSRYHGYGICRTWIMYHSENLLWLPSDYRPSCRTVKGSSAAIGCPSGRVLIFNFVDQQLSDYTRQFIEPARAPK